MAGQKIRFDVFKRDNFACQYCGRTPPEVILEVDHLIPKSNGGRDHIENLITACFDCNRGKGARDLEAPPDNVLNNLSLIKEKQRQLRAYNKLIEKQQLEIELNIAKINEVFSDSFPSQEITDQFGRVTVKKFLSLLPLSKVIEAMEIACSVKYSNPDIALRYFCGICWNWIKNPETRNWQ